MFLERAETGRVWRADVEDHVISQRREEPERIEIIVHRFLDRRDPGFAEIDSDRNGRPATACAERAQPACNDFGAVVVEPEPVDERVLLRITEDARFGISRLRFRGDGADLDETET